MSITVVSVAPAINPLVDSGNSTSRITCPLVAPIAVTAPIRPRGTSCRAFSTTRAKNGTLAALSGTIAAVGPMAVLTNRRVTPSSTISSATNGSERTTLTTVPNTSLMPRCGRRPCSPVA